MEKGERHLVLMFLPAAKKVLPQKHGNTEGALFFSMLLCFRGKL